MTTGGRWAGGKREDRLLSQLYQQVAEQKAAQFSAGHDAAAGLGRYRVWLREHTTHEQATLDATQAAKAMVDIYQNEYLPRGGREVNAIITVTPAGTPAPAATAGTGSAEIIVIDCSGSMGNPRSKIAEASRATVAAVDVIRDGWPSP